MNNRRLLYLTLLIATLTIGVVIGTIVSGGVKATAEQKAASPLVIPDPVSLSNGFSQIASQMDPAVVNITIEATLQQTQRQRGGGGRQPPSDPFDFFDFFGSPDNPDRPRRAFAEGSGFIVDKAGYILTNHHVIDNATKITVRLDDRSEHQAKLIGSDEETDLAVIKIDVGRDLPFAKLGNSDAVKVGDWVLALGNPFGLDHTVTSGIISAKGRQSSEISRGGPNRQFQSFLQTDAAINRGNSGGPLVNMAGEVIGVNTAILSETGTFAGLGFAMPSNIAIRVYNQIVQSGKVTRGAIGISYTENDPALLRAMGMKSDAGVLVQAIEPGGPAAKAGLRAGDVITEIDGKKVSNGNVLLDIVANTPVGRSVQVKVNREGRETTIPVVIEDRASVVPQTSANRPERSEPGESTQARLGLRVQDITADMARTLRLDSTEGVLIAGVEPDSAAEEAGLAQGMIIKQVIAGGGTQRMDIRNLDDFRRAERLMKSGVDVAMMILRQTGSRWQSGYLALTIP